MADGKTPATHDDVLQALTDAGEAFGLALALALNELGAEHGKVKSVARILNFAAGDESLGNAKAFTLTGIVTGIVSTLPR